MFIKLRRHMFLETPVNRQTLPTVQFLQPGSTLVIYKFYRPKVPILG